MDVACVEGEQSGCINCSTPSAGCMSLQLACARRQAECTDWEGNAIRVVYLYPGCFSFLWVAIDVSNQKYTTGGQNKQVSLISASP